MRRISERLVTHLDGAEGVQVGILQHKNYALLIDYGDGTVGETLRELGVDEIDRVLFTHHHRDQASGLLSGHLEGLRIGVPATERALFDATEAFWNDESHRWHLYDDHPQPWTLAESVSVTDSMEDGDCFEWHGAKVSVLSTPGHTDGSVSYVVDVDGRRVVFCGDVIHSPGCVWDVYSLQKGNERFTDYHGFFGAREALLASLDRILAANPDTLIPSHGEVMENPAEAINLLQDRLAACYDNYVSISALRYYFPDEFKAYEGRPGHMPHQAHLPVPDFLRHFGTTWVILSENRQAFVMDCGASKVVEKLDELCHSGEVTEVSGFWVTHYHDDHVDAIDEFQQRYPCATWADATVADVVERPVAWRIPCISPVVARIDNRTTDGDSWRWNEFTMTACHFPGQTYYHGGLLVEGHGVRLFFTGDSFTPSGIDDYCAMNRNLLGRHAGYHRCLQILSEMQPTHLFNCHVDPAWCFTAQDIAFMQETLDERERLFGELIAWEHPNYGLDAHWVRCDPYEQCAKPGDIITLRVVVTNHSDETRQLVCRPVLPRRWHQEASPATIDITARREGPAVFRFRIPSDATPERIVIPVDVVYQNRSLGQFREAVVDCSEAR
ncbi:MAG TPA: MBL fold metallo-hydrolase [Candidatus Latescibacteria bacterium]|jgi:glyoxylase-like metal-dependent hydrolase (beta-lactamase superfamily II)|nr:hypothetical protein [Gemmatimonadaceae bacterium]MDP6015677.1 MBL fold metallo-hydrolase [Candidatus Latescibacterota bacterium]HJP30019.1 MBL fold metallo-hydrolase [Candidatus Latescibacterota bacterium]